MKSVVPTRALLLATLALSLAACNREPDGGATGTLVSQVAGDTPTLDPGTTYDDASGTFVHNAYETLVTYKGNSLSTLAPLLATAWKVSNAGKTYTFTLRDGVKFHSGNTFKCADAEYTFRRNLVTNTGESGNWFLSESLLGTGANANDDKSITWQKITDAVKCDGETLVFTLPQSDPAFLSKLAYYGQSIVDSAHARKIGEWDGTEATWKAAVGKSLMGSPLSNDPSGTGAYRLVEKDASSWTVEAFGGYWGEKAKIRTVTVQKVPELATRIQAFLKGDADLIDAGSRAVIEAQLRGKPGIVVEEGPSGVAATGVVMNQNIQDQRRLGSGKLDGKGIPANFFSDVNVRRAFVAAFDAPTFIKDVQFGEGKQRNFLLPFSFLGYDETLEPPRYDLDAARAAFKEAWNGEVWKQGFTLVASYNSGNDADKAQMELLKARVESLSPRFKVILEPLEWSAVLSNAGEGKLAMVNTTWLADYADPDNFVYTFYHSKGAYGSRSNIKDPGMDRWIEQARQTSDAEERRKLYSQIARHALDQAYFIPAPALAGLVMHRENLKGITEDTNNPMFGVPWKDLSKS